MNGEIPSHDDVIDRDGETGREMKKDKGKGKFLAQYPNLRTAQKTGGTGGGGALCCQQSWIWQSAVLVKPLFLK